MPVFDVVGVGANSVDTVSLLPACPQPRGPLSKMRISRLVRCCGGQTATTLATCAAFRLRAQYVGAIGSDEPARLIRQTLVERNVDVSQVVERDAVNQFALIMIDERTGERIVLWDRDARLSLRDDEVRLDVLGAARLVHVDDVDQPAALRAAAFAQSRGLPVTSDLDRMTEQTERLVSLVSVPVFAEHLPAELTGESDHERALRKLRRSHQGLLVVTLGASGAMALEGDRLHVSPGLQVDAVDTTGAGDVFRGALIVGLLAGWSVPRLLRFANAAAGLSCQRLGAMNGVPTFEDTVRLAGPSGH